MQSYFCYSDEASISTLESLDEKIVLVGGNFGYPNFGDIAQLLNTVAFHRAQGRYRIVLVMAADAIADAGFPEFVRRAYDVDALVFVTPSAQDFADSGLGLQRVRTMRNAAALHLYGGGFLNDQWGEFVLSVAEYLLRSVQPALYLASGLQITTPFEGRVLEHVRTYKPALFGVRDELSHRWMTTTGFEPSFSFDDATEELQKLTARLPLRKGKGLLLHLNVSEYTNNATGPSGVPRELAVLASHAEARSSTTILQAYGDRRLEVFDTRETIKELERTFPFFDYRLLELAQIAFEGWPPLSEPVEGAFGYSSSYHVTLWLQLAGIPCWLRGSNLFYQQKRQALSVEQDFDAFVREPYLADHSTSLERRGAWLAQMESLVQRAPSATRTCELSYSSETAALPWRFKGNRMRQWLEQSKRLHHDIGKLSDEVSELNSRVDSERQRADELDAQIVELNATNQAERQRTQNAIAETERVHMQARALSAKVTELGSSTHAERKRADALAARADALIAQLDRSLSELERARSGLVQTAAQNAQIMNSRTWRFTKPLRFGARVLRGDWSAAWNGLRRLGRHS